MNALEGSLKQNEVELEKLGTYITSGWRFKPIIRRGEADRLVEKMFDLHAAEGGREWDREQLYCPNCIAVFAKQYFRKWWIAEKRESECSAVAVLRGSCVG